MSKIVIFGTKDTAELAHFYLSNDTEHEVVAFAVSKEYKDCDTFKGLPVVAFEGIEHLYGPKEYKFFAPMTGVNMNRSREKIYNEIKSKGYSLISYVSSRATVFPGAKIGDNCFILEDNTIQPFTSIGNNVVMWSGNHIGHHSEIKDHVFFTSHVVLSGHCIVEPYCFFGVNATIRDYSRLAKGSLISMGASVFKDTQEWGVYIGNPAKKSPKLSYEVY
ncbi:acetyltransferase [Vibrio sp. RE86]|uniref:acetyltransferase n=1 Tax=Vibrio sp. RE86 TaxID=2607605 RepID=UPI001493AEB2|nr:acetyltransferase [Vibrio sp. RE86]NOH80821.1 acetyltransferase [Vibrio sp. RE86]